MPLLNYTTALTVNKTLSDINKILTGRVAQVSTHFEEDGSASGLSFSIRTPHGIRQFYMHANVDGVHKILSGDPKVRAKGRSYTTREHAARVCWRQIKDWLDAQIALIEADMATMDQVMLPYLVIDGEGTTMYDSYRSHELAALDQ